MQNHEMPQLEPLPIPTKGMPFFQAVLTWITVNRNWRLLDNWHFVLPDGPEIIIPRGFVFDGVSVPWIIRGFISPVGSLLISSLIHDYTYRYDLLWQILDNGDVAEYNKGVGRGYWDRLFRLVAHDVSGLGLGSYITYYALRLFGWPAWNKRRKENESPHKPSFRPSIY